MEMGKIYPVMCKEVLPGDTFNIKSAFGLRFMPLAFPIQTKMRADLHFFYVRNRNLFKYWQNFITKTGSLPEGLPYLGTASFNKHHTTGSLGDYLGLPTTVSAGSELESSSTKSFWTSGSNQVSSSSAYYSLPSFRGIAPIYNSAYSSFFNGQYASGALQETQIANRIRRAFFCPIASGSVYSPTVYVNRKRLAEVVSNMSSSTENVNLTQNDLLITQKANTSDTTPSYIDYSNFTAEALDAPYQSVGNGSEQTYMPPVYANMMLLPLAMPSLKAGETVGFHLRNIAKLSGSGANPIIIATILKLGYNGTFYQPTTDFNFGASVCRCSDSTMHLEFTPSSDVSVDSQYFLLLGFSYDDYEGEGAALQQPTPTSTSAGYSPAAWASKAQVPSEMYTNLLLFPFGMLNSADTSTPSTWRFNTVTVSDTTSIVCGIQFYVQTIYTKSYSVTDYSDLSNSTKASYRRQQKISALPFRAYEAIYNSFYRDQRNNPYINPNTGEFDPNDYIPSHAGDEDNNEYDFHYRNWEQDFLTSAQLTPQQGSVTPLVGITSTGVASFRDSNGEVVTAQAVTDESADNIVRFDFDDSDKVDPAVLQSAMRVASEGISINDLRAVNSYQRWLETNLRRGYKYKDQLMSHFGVDASFRLLDMPEFIGGTSQSVDIQQINQTSASTDTDPLGSYAAQASCVGGNKGDINYYCDEHGYIIACLSIVPVPSYSQLLPKHFTKFEALDYFYPEFGHLGYQPIRYNEVCPLQAVANNVNLQDTYGYQRAWYDYLASTDEIHGQFKTTLQPFVLTRVFESVPSLTPDFLLVNQDQLNEVFTVTEIDGQNVEPILGQMHFDIRVKRKIPRYGIPRIE